MEWNRRQDEKARLKREKAQRAKDKAWKQANKPLRKCVQETQQAVNRYVLVRDAGKPCVSCGTTEQERWRASHFDAGHYRSTGAAPHLRFYTLNMAGQCVRCNRDLSGNVVEFRKGLVDRIGVELVERIEHDNTARQFDREYLERLKRLANRRARHLLRLRGKRP